MSKGGKLLSVHCGQILGEKSHEHECQGEALV